MLFHLSYTGRRYLLRTLRALRIRSFRSRSACRSSSSCWAMNFLNVPGGLPQTSSIVFAFIKWNGRASENWTQCLIVPNDADYRLPHARTFAKGLHRHTVFETEKRSVYQDVILLGHNVYYPICSTTYNRRLVEQRGVEPLLTQCKCIVLPLSLLPHRNWFPLMELNQHILVQSET